MNEEAVVSRIIEPLYRAKGWIKFAGVMFIIQGILAILSIGGILVCWIPIWMGVVLCAASNHLRVAFETNSEPECRTSMEKLGTYFRVLGFAIILLLIISVIAMIAAILIPVFAQALVTAREIAGQAP